VGDSIAAWRDLPRGVMSHQRYLFNGNRKRNNKSLWIKGETSQINSPRAGKPTAETTFARMLGALHSLPVHEDRGLHFQALASSFTEEGGGRNHRRKFSSLRSTSRMSRGISVALKSVNL